MTRPAFTPELFTRPRPGLNLKEVFATGTYEGKNYRVVAYPAITDDMDLADNPYEPQCNVAATGTLEGWPDTKDDVEQVALVRNLISERGLEFALRFTRAFIDADAVAMKTDASYPWGETECIGFGAGRDSENRMGPLDWLEFVAGWWVDLVLEVQTASYNHDGFEWVSVEYTSMPNSQCSSDSDDVLHALEFFEETVAGVCGDFELVEVKGKQLAAA